MTKKEQKKYVLNYFGIAVLANLIPILIMIIRIGKVKGDAQLGYIIFGAWSLICAIVYAFYFAIPEFSRNWEKIVGLIFPTIILSLALFEFPIFSIVIVLNLIMNGLFAWHLKKKTFANTV
jgi:chromate transport protein ChrA